MLSLSQVTLLACPRTTHPGWPQWPHFVLFLSSWNNVSLWLQLPGTHYVDQAIVQLNPTHRHPPASACLSPECWDKKLLSAIYNLTNSQQDTPDEQVQCHGLRAAWKPLIFLSMATMGPQGAAKKVSKEQISRVWSKLQNKKQWKESEDICSKTKPGDSWFLHLTEP